MQSKNLSGGQKRKVNVGIAMLGDSKIILLDEPTAGMDPTARRRLWELLKQNKEDKIIILTTHFMEEADILGDRIAIMVHGDAQCCGSSMFLKRKFGVGYNITIDKTTQHDTPHIDRFITDRIPGAIKLSEVSSEISYQLPNAAIDRFKNFFIEMDESKEDLEIKSYGVGVTTLEEVFIKVGDGIVKTEKYDNNSINANPDQQANEDYCLVDESVKGISLTMLQLYAMIVMRAKITVRECRVLFLEIFYPTLLIVIMAIILAVSTSGSNKVYTLSQSAIPKHQTVHYSYNSGNISDSSIASSFMRRYYNEGKFTMKSLGDLTETEGLNQAIGKFDDQLYEDYISDKSYIGIYLRSMQLGVERAGAFYDVITMVDPTQPEITGYAIQGTVTSILRDFTGDNEITFTIRRGPFPKSKLDDDILKIILTLLTVFSFSTALGIMTASLAGSICRERDESLKHQQIVSGGSMLSYWLSNYCIDLLKLTIPALSFIVIMEVFDVGIKLYWLFDILCIFAILPFTYLMTFIFTEEIIARNVCRYVHIFAGGILAPIVFGLLMGGNGTKMAGNILKWSFKWNPSF